MAIMRTCCCCGIRSGSIACAIYSLIIAVLGIGLYVFSVLNIDASKDMLYEVQSQYPDIFGNLDIESYICAEKAYYIFAIVVLVMTFVASIVLIIGINQDTKQMLMPFLVAKAVGFVLYLFAFAISVYSMVMIGTEYGGITLLASLIILVPFFIGDIVCFLCVLSQYQEYRDGRGRLSDVVASQRQTTLVITQQQLPPGSVGYQPLQQAPPAYAASIPQKNVPGAV